MSVAGVPPWHDVLIPQLNWKSGRTSFLKETVGDMRLALSVNCAQPLLLPPLPPLDESALPSGAPPEGVLEHDIEIADEPATPINAKTETMEETRMRGTSGGVAHAHGLRALLRREPSPCARTENA
jgi:hypothetical protein